MTPNIPEANKTPGVSYALTDDGLELPAIDITHPAFAVAPTEQELTTLTKTFVEQNSRMRALPPEVQQTIRQQLEASSIGRGLLAASGTFLTGMNTYLMKLGPDNLGKYAVEIDRRMAASLPLLSLRMRLQDVARLQAEALAPRLAERPGRPLHLINIAGGPAVDSWNTLIVLAQDPRLLLVGRHITVHVYDPDTSGPAFGRRAFDALVAPGSKLAGLDVTFLHVDYNWRDPGHLAGDLAALGLEQSVWAAASEGGLFEYGTDQEIISNLTALRSVDGGTVSGSVTRGDGLAVQLRTQGGIATVPRSLEAFTTLANQGGWHVDAAITAPFSFNVRLVGR